MSQPIPEKDQDTVVVPNVVGQTVATASSTLTNVGLVPTYEDKKGKGVINPDPEWYVQPEGQRPAGGSRVSIDSTVLLIIAASTTGRV